MKTDDRPSAPGQEKPTPSSSDTLKPVPPEQKPIERTDEELEAIAAESQKLAEKDFAVQSCCVTLLLARQLYYAGLETLRGRMEELKHKPEDGIEAHLVKSMAEAAKGPFERQTIMDKLSKHTMSWLAATIASENEAERRRRAGVEEALDTHRRTLEVDIGFRWVHPDDQELRTISRKRTVVLAGPGGAVKYLLDRALETLRATKDAGPTAPVPKCMRLVLDENRDVTKKRSGNTYRAVSYSQWNRKLKNPNQVVKVLQPFLRNMKQMAIDLLIIDDLSQVMPPGIVGAAPARTAGQALRHLRNWADEVGCGILAGLPMPNRQSVPEFGSDDDFSQLEVYSELRVVEFEEGPYDEDYEWDTYTIRINKLVAAELVGRHIIDGRKAPE